MNERIKILRKSLDLTQQEFAIRIGTARNNIAGYETGKRSPSEAVISLICRTFNVSETWLRTGEGEMFVELPKNEALAAQIQAFLQGGTDSFRERLVSLLLRLTPEQWDALEGYLVDLVKDSPALMAGEKNAATAPPPNATGQKLTAVDTTGRTTPDIAAELAELKRKNQELAAKVAAMEEEDALLGLTGAFSASPSVSAGSSRPTEKVKK